MEFLRSNKSHMSNPNSKQDQVVYFHFQKYEKNSTLVCNIHFLRQFLFYLSTSQGFRVITLRYFLLSPETVAPLPLCNAHTRMNWIDIPLNLDYLINLPPADNLPPEIFVRYVSLVFQYYQCRKVIKRWGRDEKPKPNWEKRCKMERKKER